MTYQGSSTIYKAMKEEMGLTDRGVHTEAIEVESVLSLIEAVPLEWEEIDCVQPTGEAFTFPRVVP